MREQEQTVNFAKPYRVGSEAILECKIWLGRERMKEVNEFKYLGAILCKHGSMEGEIRERTVKPLSHLADLNHNGATSRGCGVDVARSGDDVAPSLLTWLCRP